MGFCRRLAGELQFIVFSAGVDLMDGLMKRILTISRAMALGANIGLEHLVFIEGRLSVCLTPNYLPALPG